MEKNGDSPALRDDYALIAQQVERYSGSVKVMGSSPIRSFNKSKEEGGDSIEKVKEIKR